MQKRINTGALLCSLSLAVPEVQRKSSLFVTFSHKNAISPQLRMEQACLTNLKEAGTMIFLSFGKVALGQTYVCPK